LVLVSVKVLIQQDGQSVTDTQNPIRCKQQPLQIADLKYSQFFSVSSFPQLQYLVLWNVFDYVWEKKTGSSSAIKEDLLVAGQLYHPK